MSECVSVCVQMCAHAFNDTCVTETVSVICVCVCLHERVYRFLEFVSCYSVQ